MVTILPSARTPWDLIGEQAGQTAQGILQQTVPQMMQQQQTQSLFNKGFDQLGQINKDQFAKMSPLDQLSTIAKPFAAIPGGMDFLKTAYPEIVKSIMSGQTPEAQRSGMDIMNMFMNKSGEQTQPKGQVPYAPGMEPGSKASLQSKVNNVPQRPTEDVKVILKSVRPDLENQINKFTQEPTFETPREFGLTLEEEQNLREKLHSKGYRPEAIENTVNSVRNDIDRQWKAAQTKFNIGKEFYNMRDKKWEDVTKTVEANLPSMIAGYSPEVADTMKSNLYKYAAQQNPNLTDKQIYQNARALLREDEKQLKKLPLIPGMQPIRNVGGFEMASQRMKSIQNAYSAPLQKGYESALYKDAIDNKNMGPEEAHVAIWGPKMDKGTISRFSSMPKYPSKSYLKEAGGYGSSTLENPKTKQDQEKYLENLSDNLLKIKKDDDLMILRSIMLDKNLSENDFVDALKLAQDKGLELSPFQQNMLGELNQPRVRPLDEIFSSPGQYIKWLYNFITGKR